MTKQIKESDLAEMMIQVLNDMGYPVKVLTRDQLRKTAEATPEYKEMMDADEAYKKSVKIYEATSQYKTSEKLRNTFIKLRRKYETTPEHEELHDTFRGRF